MKQTYRTTSGTKLTYQTTAKTHAQNAAVQIAIRKKVLSCENTYTANEHL